MGKCCVNFLGEDLSDKKMVGGAKKLWTAPAMAIRVGGEKIELGAVWLGFKLLFPFLIDFRL